MLGLVSAPSNVPQSSHSFHFTSTETALGAAGLTAAVAVFSIWINQRSATTQRRDDHIQADHTRFLDQRRETYLSILRNLKRFYEAAKFLKYVLERMTNKPGGDDHLKRAREQLWESGLALEEVRSELAVIAPKPVEDASTKIKEAYRDSVVAEGVLQYFNPDEPRPYDPEKPQSGQGQALRNALSTVNDVIAQTENAQEVFVQAVRADLRIDVGSVDVRSETQKPRLRL